MTGPTPETTRLEQAARLHDRAEVIRDHPSLLVESLRTDVDRLLAMIDDLYGLVVEGERAVGELTETLLREQDRDDDDEAPGVVF